MFVISRVRFTCKMYQFIWLRIVTPTYFLMRDGIAVAEPAHEFLIQSLFETGK